MNQEKHFKHIYSKEESIEAVFDKMNTNSNEESKGLSPIIWQSLSILAAVLLAVNNQIKSQISHFHYKARMLQSPGYLTANIATFVILRYFSKSSQEEAPLMTDKEKQALSDEEPQTIGFLKPVTNSSTKTQLYVFVALVLINILTYITFIEALNYTQMAHVNIGVLIALFCTKPILSWLFFRVCFGERASMYHLIGIGFCVLAVISVAISKLDREDIMMGNLAEFMKAFGMLILTVLMLVIRNVLHRLFFSAGQSKAKSIDVHNYVNAWVTILMTIAFISVWIRGFEFTWNDLIISSIGGALNLVISFITLAIVVQGKAGASEALLTTSVIFQIALDAILYGRFPDVLQIIGVIFSMISSLVIILGR